MSGVNGQQFGHFTYKNRDYDLKQFDVNENGKLEKSEVDALLERLAQETGEDILELSNVVNSHDINKDGNLDINEMNRWQIEDTVNAKVNAFDATISADFIGDLAQYQSRARADIRAFAQQFINDAVNNMANGNVNLQTIASQFETELNTQYTTVIKPEYERLCNEANQEKLISNITDNVIEYILESRPDMSDSQIEKLGDWVFAEATRLAKSPENLSAEQITQQIIDKLDEVPADMTDDEAFEDWDTYSAAVEEAGVYIDQTELTNLKAKAKALITHAMAKGIKLQQNGHDINTSTMNNLIEREFGGSSGGHKLIEWINKIRDAIKDVSSLTFADLVAYGAQNLTLDIDTCTIGNIPKLDPETMQTEARAIIEKVMRDKGITSENYNAQTRNLFGQALNSFAARFIDSYSGTSTSAFKSELETALGAYFDCPVSKEAIDKFNEYKDSITAIDLTNPDENDIADLRAVLKELQQTVDEAGIKLLGKDGVVLNLNTIDITIDNIENIIAALKDLCEQINSYVKDNSTPTLADIIANNQNKDWAIRIDIDLANGTVSLHETPVSFEDPEYAEVLDNVIESLLANVSSGHKTEIVERMTAYAQLIIKQYPINGDVELREWLMDKLTEFVNNPVKLLSKLIVDLDLGEKSEYDSVCTDEEFTKLTNAVKDIIELANTIGIVFINPENGKAMTAATIIAKYNKENAGDLYDLIMSIKDTFAGNITSIAGMFTNNNTKGKLYYVVGESKISKPTFDNTNPNDGTNIPTGKTAFNSLANARDRIRISLKPILERRAKDLCESYGIPESQWKNVFETIFEEELRSAVDNNWEWDSFLHLCYLVHCRPAANDTREGVVKRMSNWVEQWLQDNN